MTECDRRRTAAASARFDSASTGIDAFAAAAFQTACLAASFASLATLDSDPEPLSASTAAGLSLPLVFAAALLCNRARASKLPLRQLLGIKKPLREIFFGVSAGILMMPVAMLLTFLTSTLAIRMGFEQPPAQWLTLSLMHPETTLAAKTIAAIGAVVAAPLTEELLTRWALAGWLTQRMSTAVAALITAAFFALLHLSIISSLGLFALGLLFAALYFRSGSLLTPIAAHAAFNLANLVMLLLD